MATADTEYAMPTTNTPFDSYPNDPGRSQVQQILVYAFDADNNQIPLKTLRITNNTEFTVYPIMRDANEAETTTGKGLYDPYDHVQTEYRGYIGYKGTDGKYYFGLKKRQSITVRVPLVFWNGARIGILTDGQWLTPAAGAPNPYHYDANSQRVIVTAEHADPEDKTPPDPEKDGVVMWYRAEKLAPSLDSPDQLAEWTIRDQKYLSNPAITDKTNKEIPEREKVDLINYDVSYVDNMFLPVAMEALDVPVPAPPEPFNQNRGAYGWIGAINKPEDLRDKIKDFTADKNTLLGKYFGGSGWPTYNISRDRFADYIKIPAGQNVFAQSPLANTPSSYVANTYMLSSGGTDPISISIGGEGKASTGNVITLSSNADITLVKKVQAEFDVIGHKDRALGRNPIEPGTKVRSVHVGTGPTDPSKVYLTKDIVASEEATTFDFVRPKSDYASEAMIKLWYSWAKYYLDQTHSTPEQRLKGGVVRDTATLTFSARITELIEGELIEGMQVTGPGLDNPDATKEQGGVTILAIAADEKSVTLSQLARETHPLSEGRMFTFVKPQPLPVTPARLHDLDFSKDPEEAARVPLEFAKKVYQVMAAMAQIPKNPDPHVTTPHVIELMNNVVGGNMGFIFDTNARRFSDDGLAISAIIRDMIKSVLRGVTDFTKFSEFDGKERIWYPDPRVERGGLKFNVFNLDPFVWFVHVQLGFSGYGFSLDDDTADVGAGGATRLQLTIGGKDHLLNSDEWTIQAPYGPVTGKGNWDSSKTVSFGLGITGATNKTPIVITSSGKQNLANGEKVIISGVEGNTAANGPFTVANSNPATKTFELRDSAGNGDYTGGGKWTRPPLPYISGVDALNVYWKLKGDDRDAGFQGAILSGPGVQGKGSVRLQQLGDDKLGILALNTKLTNPDGSDLPNGEYQWTFDGNVTPKPGS